MKKNLKKQFPKNVRNTIDIWNETSPLPFLIVDQQWKIHFSNHHFEIISGFSVYELDNQDIQKLLPSFNEHKEKIQILNQQDSGMMIMTELLSKNKTIQRYKLYLSLIPPSTKGYYLFLFTENIDLEPHEDTPGLKQSIEFIENISNAGTFFLDADRKMLTASATTFSILGSSNTGSVYFSDFLRIVRRKEDREKLEKSFISLDEHGDHFVQEIQLNTGDGKIKTPKTVKLMAGLFSKDAKEFYTGSIQDITAEKKAEKELFKSKNIAEKADYFKSVFLTNLSHEIRTPMNSIMGFSEILNNQDLPREKVKEYTAIIQAKGRFLLSLIDDAIELSRFKTGQIQVNKIEFSLYPLLKELYDEYEAKRKQQSKENIELIFHEDEVLKSIQLYSDPGRIQQILSNILSNALKFTEKGVIELNYKLSNNKIRFYIKDMGIGLDPSDMKNIFHRFEDIEDTTRTKTRISGTGLSLTITKYIVEELGGKIKVKSELKKGSTFQVNLPLESPENNKKKVEKDRSSISNIKWKDKVILIAEDEDISYRFLETILQNTEVKILRARNGREALELCQSINQIDLVLMDIKMPEMNGYNATRAIKAIRPDLPVIAQTAFSIQDELMKCKQAGCDDYLIKPIDTKQLIRKINHYFLH